MVAQSRMTKGIRPTFSLTTTLSSWFPVRGFASDLLLSSLAFVMQFKRLHDRMVELHLNSSFWSRLIAVELEATLLQADNENQRIKSSFFPGNRMHQSAFVVVQERFGIIECYHKLTGLPPGMRELNEIYYPQIRQRSLESHVMVSPSKCGILKVEFLDNHATEGPDGLQYSRSLNRNGFENGDAVQPEFSLQPSYG